MIYLYRVLCLFFLLLPSIEVMAEDRVEDRVAIYRGHLEIKPERPNIAKFIRKTSSLTHRGDFTGNNLTFNPVNRVLIKDVKITVEGINTKQSDFILGDNCLYMATTIESDYALPLGTELHCTGTSVWNDTGYTRTLSFNDPKLGFIIDAHAQFSCPVHVALIHPDVLSPSEIEGAKVECSITYVPVDADTTLYKFIRIPYLDQYSDAPQLISPDKSWYKEWSDGSPLKVKGFSLYYNPKPFRDQILKNGCLYVLDKNGAKMENNGICLPDQIYVAGQTHLQYEPAFVKTDLVVEKGSALSGSCDLYKGNKAGDCVLYVLIEIPDHLRDSVKASPTYYSNGIVNFKYMRGEYCSRDIFDNRLTQLGRKVIMNIGTTPLKPWVDQRNEASSLDGGLNSHNCSNIFID